jgi:cytochrome c-type protein NapC
MEATNTERFCISCHEMNDNVYQEYKETIHSSNRTGVRAARAASSIAADRVPR